MLYSESAELNSSLKIMTKSWEKRCKVNDGTKIHPELHKVSETLSQILRPLGNPWQYAEFKSSGIIGVFGYVT